MSPEEKWNEYKLDQLSRVKGLTFELRRWASPSDGWDHDHCLGCWAKFAEFDGPEILHEGYVNTNSDTEMHWVCPDCMAKFRKALGFIIA